MSVVKTCLASRKLIMKKAKNLYDKNVGDDPCAKEAFVGSF